MTAPRRVHSMCGVPRCPNRAEVEAIDDGPGSSRAARCRVHRGRSWSCPRCAPYTYARRRWCPVCLGVEWVRAAVVVDELRAGLRGHGDGRRALLQLLRARHAGAVLFYDEESMSIVVEHPPDFEAPEGYWPDEGTQNRRNGRLGGGV